MGRSIDDIDEASGLRKPPLTRINAPAPQDGKPRTLLEHLEGENAKLRACLVELLQQIRGLRGR
jgi:hypothetical protein